MRQFVLPKKGMLFLLCSLIACRSQKPKTVENPEFQTALHELSQRTGATLDWENALAEVTGEFGVGEVFSVDLERLWVSDSLIAFRGRVVDVAGHGPQHYLVTLERDVLVGPPHLKDLRLEVLCPKDIVDAVLLKSRRSQFLWGVIVAAKVERVRRSEKPSSEGSETVLTGEGTCVDMKGVSHLRGPNR